MEVRLATDLRSNPFDVSVNSIRPSRSVLHGLGDVLGLDSIRAFQVGDSEGELEDAVESAGGEVQLFHSYLEQTLSIVLDFT